MSYILEGLKKLEQKRRQEEGSPDLLAFQAESPRKPEKRPLWPYLLFAVLLINAGVIIWWIAPWRSADRKTPVQPPPVARQGTPMAAATASVETKEQNRNIPIKEPQQSKTVSAPPTDTERNVTKEPPRAVVKESPVPGRPPVVATASLDTRQVNTKSKPPADGHVIKLSEIPSEIRNGLPMFKMSAHFYSTDKQARFARINDKILHEGEILSEGLKVDEINPGGAVFSYKGYRFLVGINER
jgi:general secretion pathway protein B